MKKLARASVFATTVLASMALAIPASACTGVIIGGDLTTDGSTIFGRTEDLEQNHPKRLLVHEAGEFKKGQKITSGEKDTAVSYIQEKDSLKFTSISDTTPEYGHFDEAGFNSAGVAVDATISAKANPKVLEKDPYTKPGWTEGIITSVLLPNATSARNGIELAAKLIEKDGAQEGNALVIADKNELWYMEIYTGHQYSAMKYPRDKFSIMPNAFWVNEVDCADKSKFLCSANLEKTVKEAGTYAETNGKFDVAKSYNPTGEAARNSSRVWSGIKFLDPGSKATIKDSEYPLLNTPSKEFKKLAITDVMALQRNRFEKVDPKLAQSSQKVVADSEMKDAAGKPVVGARYPIGNTNTMEAHIFQFPVKGMPTEIPGTLWQTIGTPQSSFYLPYYGNITETIKPMQSTSADPKDASSYYWVATQANMIVDKDRATLQGPVREYMAAMEQGLVNKRPGEDKKLAAKHSANPHEAAKWATGEFTKVSNQAFEDLKSLVAALKVYNTTHKLQSKGADFVTFAPKQAVLPMEFKSEALKEMPKLEKGNRVIAGWELKLVEKLANKKVRPASVKGEVHVSVALDPKLNVAGAKLVHQLADGKTQELPFTVSGATMTFKTTSFSKFMLVTTQGDTPGTGPSVDPTVKPTVPGTPAPTKSPAAGKGLAKTGANTSVLWLMLITVAGGVGMLVARRMRNGS